MQLSVQFSNALETSTQLKKVYWSCKAVIGVDIDSVVCYYLTLKATISLALKKKRF